MTKLGNANVHQIHRLLELQSSGRKNELRLHYRKSSQTGSSSTSSSHNTMAVESIPLVLADESWHRLAVTVSGNQLKIFLDCQ